MRVAAPVIKLRDALPDELVDIGRLLQLAYSEFESSFPPERWSVIHANLGNPERWSPGGQVILVSDDGVPAGSVQYFPPGGSDGRLFETTWSSVRMLGVHPAYRRKGVSQMLMNDCLERAIQDGAKVLALHTSEVMEVARAMYERMGFEVHHQIEGSVPATLVYTLLLSR